MLEQILHSVESGAPAQDKVNWFTTVALWVAVGVGSYFVSSRFGSAPGARIAFLVAAFVAGLAVAYAVLKAWQSALWSYALHYIDAAAVRRRLSEL